MVQVAEENGLEMGNALPAAVSSASPVALGKDTFFAGKYDFTQSARHIRRI